MNDDTQVHQAATPPTVEAQKSDGDVEDSEEVADGGRTPHPHGPGTAGEKTAEYTLREDDGKELDDLKKGDQVDLTLAEAEAVLAATRKRAEGWRNGSASLVALIVASLALRTGTAWVTLFSGWKLYVLTGAIVVALGLAMGSMWLTLRAANGPFSLDTKVRDYRRPHDAPRIFNRATSAASNLKLGQFLLWAGVLLFALVVFATWLIDPTDPGVLLR